MIEEGGYSYGVKYGVMGFWMHSTATASEDGEGRKGLKRNKDVSCFRFHV